VLEVSREFILALSSEQMLHCLSYTCLWWLQS